MTREKLDFIAWQHEDDYLLREYNKAYYRFVFCSEGEKEESKEKLDILRSKYFNH